MIKIDPRAMGVVREFEQLRLKAYKPTPDDVWTIGWGHTRGVTEGDTCTLEQADQWLEEDMQVAAETVKRETRNIPVKLSASAEAALVSLTYNTGTLGPTIKSKLLGGAVYMAWEFMAKWRKQGRKDLRGLARRRAVEMTLFMEDKFP